MGPLYAYKTLSDKTEVTLGGGATRRAGGVPRADHARHQDLQRQHHARIPGAARALTVTSSGRRLAERAAAVTDRWTGEYVRRDGERLFVTVKPNTTVEFR